MSPALAAATERVRAELAPAPSGAAMPGLCDRLGHVDEPANQLSGDRFVLPTTIPDTCPLGVEP
jgi:hypothetical protein